jgi:alpha-beta hydrolase superfamily lysophospholipase
MLFIASCAAQPPGPPPLEAPQPSQPRIDVLSQRWQDYVDWATSDPLQADCVPRRVEPGPEAEYRGTVVLLHGFTACPQQYFEMAGLLSERGFRSLIVLLPGHGHQYPDVDNDNSSPQPGPWNWKGSYNAFADRINGVMEYADGDRVIVGLSGGGAASLYINMRARETYDRSLVIAPFLAIAGGDLINAAVAAIGAIPIVNMLDATPFGAEKPCIEKRKQGKAGYCEFQVRHIAGMKSLAHWTRREIRTAPLDLQIQIVAVEHDNSVSNQRIADLLNLLSDNGTTTACIYEDGVPHSMFSRVDHPGEDMYWLDSFLDSALGFIVDAQPFPQDPIPGEPGLAYGRCRIAAGRGVS